MMRRYPAYRDSGVEWLGEVPEAWRVDRVWASMLDTKNGVWGADPEESAEDVLLCVRVADFNRTALIAEPVEGTMRAVSPSERNGRLLRRGDLLLEKSGGGENQQVGAVVLYDRDDEAVCSNFVAKVTLREGMDPRFWVYLHSSLYQIGINGRSIKQTSGIQNLDQKAYFNELVPVPPSPEQTAIAAFLDRETAKIDALVEEQRRLITLLREKRQAVISHAVTKGLNPAAPMKPSGVDWLGDVPEEWEVAPLKHLCSHVVDCLHTTPTYDGELLYPAIRTADVERGNLKLDQARLVSADIYLQRIQRLRPQENDILYSREGERLGLAALVPPGVDICLGQRMMMFRVRDDLDPAFMMWALNSDSIYQQVIQRNIGSTSPHVNIGDIVAFRLAVPSLSEQRAISSFVSAQADRIDSTIAVSQSAIDLLQERRAALISAAVTGKIEVRGLVPEETEAA